MTERTPVETLAFVNRLCRLIGEPSVEMIEAGVEHWHAHWGDKLLDDFVRDIFGAMFKVAMQQAETDGQPT